MKKYIIILAIALFIYIIGLGFYLTVKGPQSDFIKNEPINNIKIGFIAPLTGEASNVGTTLLNVAELTIKEIENDKREQQFQLIVEDGKCSPKDAVSAVQKLISVDQVNIIIFGGCSGEVLAAAPLIDEHQVIGIATIAGSPDISQAGDYLFRLSLSDDRQSEFVANHITKQGFKRVAVISENTDYSQALRNSFKSSVDNKIIVADELYNTSDTDFQTLLTKVKSKKPEAIFIIPGGALTTTGLLTKEIYELGIKSQLYGTDQFTFDDLINDYSQYYQGMILAEAKFDPSNAAAKRLFEKYQETYSEKCSMGLFCATTHDALLLVKEAIDKCGSDNKTDCIKNYLYSIQAKAMTSGDLTIDENGDAQFEFEFKKINGNESVKL